MNRIVNKIVSKYHSRNPIDIAQGMNIKVAYADLGENVHGFYQYYKRGMVISSTVHLMSLCNFKYCVTK